MTLSDAGDVAHRSHNENLYYVSVYHDNEYITPNLDWLRALVVFAEHESFTHAARALHLSQPALHVQIKKLSEQLGVPLYRRRGRALELTPEGVRAVAFAREMLERSARFVEGLRGVERARPVVLAAGEGAFLYVLGERVRAALAAKVALRTLVRDAEGTLEAVISGEAHVGVAAVDEPPRELEQKALVRAGNALLVPRKHRLACRRWVRVADLLGEPLVAPPRGRPQREALEVAARSEDVALSVVVETVGWPIALRFVELGVGLAIVNDVVTAPRGLVSVPLRGLPPRTYWAVRTGARSAEAERAWEILTA